MLTMNNCNSLYDKQYTNMSQLELQDFCDMRAKTERQQSNRFSKTYSAKLHRDKFI